MLNNLAAEPHNSTCVLGSLPGKLAITRHSPCILLSMIQIALCGLTRALKAHINAKTKYQVTLMSSFKLLYTSFMHLSHFILVRYFRT